MKIGYLLTGVFTFLLSFIIGSVTAQVEGDSLSDNGSKEDSIKVVVQEIVEDNEYIMAMLDSLVAINFYTNSEFTTDTASLNVYNFPADTVPVYPDSIVIGWLEELNRESLIDLTFNKYVKNYIRAYSVKRRKVASNVLGLAEVYFPLFEEYLDKYDMPLELKYLAVVESALNTTAKSRAGAKGLWQIM